jgi:hypothetical protein
MEKCNSYTGSEWTFTKFSRRLIFQLNKSNGARCTYILTISKRDRTIHVYVFKELTVITKFF